MNTIYVKKTETKKILTTVNNHEVKRARNLLCPNL